MQDLIDPPSGLFGKILRRFADRSAERDAADRIFERIVATPLAPSPYPHFFTPYVLPPELFAEVARHWPVADAFAPEGTPGVYLKELVTDHVSKLDGLPEPLARFWGAFVNAAIPGIVAGTMAQYRNCVRLRYGDALGEVRIKYLALMESREGYFGHNVHVHHYVPDWLFTNLIYVDDYGSDSRGTTLFGFAADDPHQAAEAAVTASEKYESTFGSNTPYAGELGLKPAFQAPFQGNGMISFFETALSFHSGPQTPAGRTDQARKVIRMHFQAPPGLAPEHVPIAKLERSLKVECFEQDARLIRDAMRVPVDADESRSWAKAIRVPPIRRG